MKQVLLLTIGLKNSNEMCFTNDESQGDSPSNLLHKKTPSNFGVNIFMERFKYDIRP